MNKVNVKQILNTAHTEYVKWICNARMILMAVMLIFSYSFIIQPLKDHAGKMHSPLNALEPYIALINSDVLVIIVPAVFMALMSDFPRTDGNTLFFISRTGKINWLLGQVFMSIYAIITYMAVIFLGTFLPLCSSSFWANGWSLTVTDYGISFPEEYNSFACLLIKKNLYNQVSPFHAALEGTAFLVLYLFLLSLVMLLFRCIKLKIFGMLCAGAIIAFGGTLSLIKNSFMWVFPMAHTSIAMHFTEYYRKPVMEIWKSYVYFGVFSTVLLTFSFFTLKKISFDSVQDID